MHTFTIIMEIIILTTLSVVPSLTLYLVLRFVHIKLSDIGMAIVLPLIYTIPVVAYNADTFHHSIIDGLEMTGAAFALFVYLTLSVIALRRGIRFDRQYIRAGNMALTVQQARKRLRLVLPFIVNPATLILVVWMLLSKADFLLSAPKKRTRRVVQQPKNDSPLDEDDDDFFCGQNPGESGRIRFAGQSYMMDDD